MSRSLACSRPMAVRRSLRRKSRRRKAAGVAATRGGGSANRASWSGQRARRRRNATGVWADQLRPQELHEEAELPSIRPSRGTHILLRSAELPLRGGAIVPAGGGR